jgi:YHS domain-containing protein
MAARGVVILVGLVVFAFSTGAGYPDPDRTLRVDAVELLAGREVSGQERYTHTRGRYTYWFASPRTLAAFQADPQRFEIQLGGACARMGPLSGPGTTEIHAVHDGRLYIFASESCRHTFMARADELLEADDPQPAWTPESVARGRALLERAVAATGGAEATDRVRTYSNRIEREVTSGETTYHVVREVFVEFPDRLRRQQAWNDDVWGQVAAPDGAFLFGPEEKRAMVESQRRAFEKEMGRSVLMTLRSRNTPGCLVAHTGSGEIDGTPVEYVDVSLDGLTNRVAIDTETGRVLSLAYRGRGPGMAFGWREDRFADFRTVGALTLPFAFDVVFDGKPIESLSRRYDAIEIDVELDGTLFQTG